jgi:signal transduction histidine kinase
MRILLADDEKLILEVLEKFLSYEGHEVFCVENGDDALTAIKSVKLDAAFLDICMPGQTGLEILEKIGDMDDPPLVILLTGHASVESASLAVRCGAFEFLQKPVRLASLGNLLNRAEKLISLRRENRSYREHLEKLVDEKTAELRMRNNELQNVCERLTVALESAKRSSRLAALGELASGVAHEIRNPLSAIALASGNLASEVGGNEVALECVKDIRRTIDHLSQTVERVLSFARPPTPRLLKGSVYAMVDRALALSRVYLSKNRIALNRSLDDGLPETAMDEGQCAQILLNLIINAVRAMPEGGDIDLRAWTEGHRLCISVEDNGSGVPEGMRQKIFAPFFSGFQNGSGLGLSISRSYAESHGGDLVAADRPDKKRGACFILILPIVAEIAEPSPAQLSREQS